MGKLIGAAFLAFLAYVLTPFVILIVGNIGIFLGNMVIYIWYFLKNAWAFIAASTSYLDYLVCSLPFSPIVSWGVFGAIVGFVAAFIYSVQGKRRSYLRLNLIIVALAVLILGTMAYLSQSGYQNFLARQEKLAADTSLAQIRLNLGRADLFANPNIVSPQLARLDNGTEIFRAADEGDWLKVFHNAYDGIVEGYVRKRDVMVPEKNVPKVIIAHVNVPNGATVRSGPGTNYAKKDALPKGARLEVLEESGNWVKVSYEKGGAKDTGFVYKTLLSFEDDGSSPESNTARAPRQPNLARQPEPPASTTPATRQNRSTASSANPAREPAASPATRSQNPPPPSEPLTVKTPTANTEPPIVPFYSLSEKPTETKRVEPAYPELAKKAGIEGAVVVKVLVNTAGKVEKVEVLKSHPLLDEAAIAAAKQFEFTPGKVQGEAVKVWLSIPFNFSLRQASQNYTPEGNWRGLVKQSGYGAYLVIMQLDRLVKGSRCGTIEYPSLKCGGSLTLIEIQGPLYILKENLTSGNCIKGGVIHLQKQNDGNLSWTWYYPGETRKGASGVLNPGSR